MPLALDDKLKAMIRGDVEFTSTNLGFNLLISRLRKRYGQNSTPAELAACMQDVHNFLTKYESIMSKEFDAIAKA